MRVRELENLHCLHLSQTNDHVHWLVTRIFLPVLGPSLVTNIRRTISDGGSHLSNAAVPPSFSSFAVAACVNYLASIVDVSGMIGIIAKSRARCYSSAGLETRARSHLFLFLSTRCQWRWNGRFNRTLVKQR